MAENISAYLQLGEVLMAEDTLRKNSGSFNRKQMWMALPEKLPYRNFCLIVDYLISTNKITTDRRGTLVWIWNPKGVAKYRKRKDLEWQG